MNRFSTAALHTAKVGLHILGAIVVYGIASYLFHNPEAVANISHFVPLAVINMLLAGAVKYFSLPVDLPLDVFGEDK